MAWLGNVTAHTLRLIIDGLYVWHVPCQDVCSHILYWCYLFVFYLQYSFWGIGSLSIIALLILKCATTDDNDGGGPKPWAQKVTQIHRKHVIYVFHSDSMHLSTDQSSRLYSIGNPPARVIGTWYCLVIFVYSRQTPSHLKERKWMCSELEAIRRCLDKLFMSVLWPEMWEYLSVCDHIDQLYPWRAAWVSFNLNNFTVQILHLAPKDMFRDPYHNHEVMLTATLP